MGSPWAAALKQELGKVALGKLVSQWGASDGFGLVPLIIYFFFFNSAALGLRLQNGLLTPFPVWQKPEVKGNCVRKVL